jgi:beta-glucosidase
MFRLGLFENPYVDEAVAGREVGRSDFVSAGRAIQAQSTVLLRNERDFLPLPKKAKVYLENVDPEEAAQYGTVVQAIGDADVALVKIDTPYVTRKDDTSYFRITREGPLVYRGADNESELVAVQRLVASGKPVVVFVHLERPGVLTELVGTNAPRALLAHFGSSDAALLDIAFGRMVPRGKLPVDLPRDQESVEEQLEDVPFDLRDPLFRHGFGLAFTR